ncbi:4-(cytidine 5'-diphospho)-2-C-methyl-D-erythritol kinase [candidate division WOR-3 bacterium]|nr:4-(cytidine 5'-diphospho)-2-C-methyl-D-erythritol kinase [candidate division WOR-3 bacterium]
MNSLVLPAHAKINLGLWVGKKRTDGFHDIVTIVAPIALHDRVVIRKTKRGITVSPLGAGSKTRNPGPTAPWDSTNLAHRAAATFFQAARVKGGCSIRIAKRIPVGGGLGGGSSDAAAVLAGLSRLFGEPLSRRRLHRVAAALGSDVPGFLMNGPCIARGRGEKLRRVRLPRLELLLCFPGYAVSTAWAYAELDRLRAAGQGLTRPAVSPKILLASLRRSELDRVAAQLSNSFEPAVFRRFPALGRARDLLVRHGALAASLSGSGSTVYGLVDDKGWKDPMAALARSGFHCVKTNTI